MLVLSTRIVLDCFYLLIFYSEKFSTDVRRLPYAVNVNLNLSIIKPTTGSSIRAVYRCIRTRPWRFNCPPDKSLSSGYVLGKPIVLSTE